jgi:hypothetical protein
VICQVDSAGTEVYSDTVEVSWLEPGRGTDVWFLGWDPGRPGAEYEVTVRTALAGDQEPANDVISRWVTVSGEPPDTIPPSVISSLPEDGQTGVPIDPLILVDFSEPMDRWATEEAVRIQPETDHSRFWDDDSTLAIVPSVSLGMGETYTLMVDAGASDIAGNPMEDDVSISFATVEPFNRPPLVEIEPVSPGWGDTATYFLYKVFCIDEDGDSVDVQVVVDGEGYPAEFMGGDPITGMHFLFETTLEPGMHDYHAEAEDEAGNVSRTPPEGEFPGPEVLE